MRKTLYLSPPSFDGFDGGAGARYQARREEPHQHDTNSGVGSCGTGYTTQRDELLAKIAEAKNGG